jgi:hypothetical protein
VRCSEVYEQVYPRNPAFANSGNVFSGICTFHNFLLCDHNPASVFSGMGFSDNYILVMALFSEFSPFILVLHIRNPEIAFFGMGFSENYIHVMPRARLFCRSRD